MDYKKRLHAAIPGGAHTYSRGDDQYPANAPPLLERGLGGYVWDPEGNKFLDYGMGLRSVTIGYAEPEINEAAIRGAALGNNLTRASLIELEAAEKMISLIDSVDMVKFTKNGSSATSAAIKLARAYTGRELVGRCLDHPFFSYDDWFIGSTPIKKGIPSSTISETKTFLYNNIKSLENLFLEFPNQIACIILEPAALNCPSLVEDAGNCCGKKICSRNYSGAGKNYLQQVEALCNKNGVIFILDETITGFRWSVNGAQSIYGVTPDLCTFGKGMANGFSVAAVAGKKEIMSLGGIEEPGQERLFLLSTTHGAEMSGLSAFLATVDFIERNPVIDHLWAYGEKFISIFNGLAVKHGIENYILARGPAANPHYLTFNSDGTPSMELRTLFSQEMLKHNILMPWLAFCYRHNEESFYLTEKAIDSAFGACSKAISQDRIRESIVGPVIKPVFRKYN